MTARRTSEPSQAVITVSAMAKAVGLSRSRFYDHVRDGVFPTPVYCVVTRRPLYPLELQHEILTVRRTGIGCNGRYVLFYERCPTTTADEPPKRPQSKDTHSGLLDGLRALGLSTVTAARVQEALNVVRPSGIAGEEPAILLRDVYRHLRRTGVA